MSRSGSEHDKRREAGPRHVRLPGFIDDDIGLGDLVKRGTSAVGIRPCGGCARRAEALNHRVIITGRRTR